MSLVKNADFMMHPLFVDLRRAYGARDSGPASSQRKKGGERGRESLIFTLSGGLRFNVRADVRRWLPAGRL